MNCRFIVATFQLAITFQFSVPLQNFFETIILVSVVLYANGELLYTIF